MTSGNRTACCQVIFDLCRIQSGEVRGLDSLHSSLAPLTSERLGALSLVDPNFSNLEAWAITAKVLEAHKHFRFLAVFVSEDCVMKMRGCLKNAFSWTTPCARS